MRAYIVTTIDPDTGDRHPCAVATLEEARQLAVDEIDRRLPDRATTGRYRSQAAVSGTIGPLLDGTVIEVRRDSEAMPTALTVEGLSARFHPNIRQR